MAGIEKAFLMISMAEKDRDVMHLLWFEDIFHNQPEIIVLRLSRVVFGVPSSPFLLNITIRHYVEGFSSSHPELVQSILNYIYVDGVTYGAADENQAYELYVQSKDILRRGGLNLQKFTSSSESLQAKIDGEEDHSIYWSNKVIREGL